jgi:hypothetical protein
VLLIVLKFGLLEFQLQPLPLQSGSGLLMQKFSFGDEDRIREKKKVVRGSLFAYIFILAIDLVLSTIQLLMTRGE